MTIYSQEVISALVLIVTLSWILPKKFQMLSSLIITVIFLMFYDINSLLILVVISITSYFIPKKYSFNTNILLLFILFISMIFIIFKALSSLENFDYIMPLGLSFYSFRVIHYIFEGYKQKLPEHTFYDYIIYLFFLPTLIVGPINRFVQFQSDLKSRSLKNVNFSIGFERILYGYAKIIILSSYILDGKVNNYLTNIEQTNEYLFRYLSSIDYWLNLYFQFSGYSDIAIGISYLMGFKIIENFNYPFFSKNISEFWQRWHISLSKWIKDYVYMPLVALTRKPFFAILMSLIILGLWHEFSLRYVIWGFYHALGITIWHKFQLLKSKNIYIMQITKSKTFTLFSIFITFNFVILSFEITSYLVKVC